jgi:protein-disulfide isomerase
MQLDMAPFAAFRRAIAPAVLAWACAWAPVPAAAQTPAGAQTFAPDQRSEIEKIVREYLLSHPEVLQDAMAELDKRQNEADAEKHLAAIKDNATAIFSSSRQVNLGNPQGDVTMVEFFDYNCAFCKRAMADMLDLLKSDSKLKVVLKEFPVLGEGSVQAAQVAVAARMQDKTGKKYLDFHTKLLGGRGPADKARALAAAKEAGFDMARLDKDLQSDEVKQTLEENLKLAEGLGLNGTPSYVFPAEVVVGAVGLPTLKGKVNIARCGKETC